VWIPAALLPATIGAAAIVAPFLLSRIKDIENVAGVMHLETMPLIAASAVLAAALAGSLIVRRFHLFFAFTVATCVTLALYLCLIAFPPINAVKSGRRLCYAIDAEWPREKPDRVMSYDIFRAEYILFGNYFLTEVNDYEPVVEAFRGPERAFCILRAGSLGNLRRALGPTPLFILWQNYVGHRLMAVVSNRPSRLPHLRESMRRQAAAQSARPQAVKQAIRPTGQTSALAVRCRERRKNEA